MSVQPTLHSEEIPSVEKLDASDCWSLLGEASIGRLAVRTTDSVDIFPVNFVAHDGAIFIRSAPGSKLVDITRAAAVAFEIDGSGRLDHWSVVAHGRAERMSSDLEIEASGVLGLHTMTSSAKWNYIRISVDSITGRRFEIAALAPDTQLARPLTTFER
ncbi:MAG: pyridoxamine 5'-phosphate oxidase family protein [Rhodoglobus sp.]